MCPLETNKTNIEKYLVSLKTNIKNMEGYHLKKTNKYREVSLETNKTNIETYHLKQIIKFGGHLKQVKQIF